MTSRARRRYTDEQRAAALARFDRSDLSQAEFCRRAGIRVSTFSLWRRSGGAARQVRPRMPGFAEVRLSAPAATSAVTLHLPSGARLEVATGSDAMWHGLGLLLRSLYT
ncbi:MAG TPA: transposase [Terriglobia bacterium]|nr:transposase [Terriglobia bacterium]